MSEQVIVAATQAIFQLQFSTNEAIRFVVKETGVSPKIAGQALREVMVGYKL
jgi:hypothetical protein